MFRLYPYTRLAFPRDTTINYYKIRLLCDVYTAHILNHELLPVTRYFTTGAKLFLFLTAKSSLLVFRTLLRHFNKRSRLFNFRDAAAVVRRVARAAREKFRSCARIFFFFPSKSVRLPERNNNSNMSRDDKSPRKKY